MPIKLGPALATRPDTIVVRDEHEVNDLLPYQPPPHRRSSAGEVRIDRSDVGICFEVTELTLIGVWRELQRPRYVHLEPPPLPTPDDMIVFCAVLETLHLLREDHSLRAAASSGSLVLEAAKFHDQGSVSGTLDPGEVREAVDSSTTDTVTVQPIGPPAGPDATAFISARDIMMRTPTVIIGNRGQQC